MIYITEDIPFMRRRREDVSCVEPRVASAVVGHVMICQLAPYGSCNSVLKN